MLVLGEVRREIESIRRRDAASAMALEHWLTRLADEFADRILPVDVATGVRVLDPTSG